MLLQGEKKMPHRIGFQPLSGMAIQIRIADQKLNGQPKNVKFRSRAKKATPKVTPVQTSINQAVNLRFFCQ